jgi:hypothetical protein
MDPDQIKTLVEKEYPDLVSKPRHNPNGWSFYHRIVQGGAKSTLIGRVVQRRPGAPVLFKPAVSARSEQNKALEVRITGGAAQVRDLLDHELSLWRADSTEMAVAHPNVEFRSGAPLLQNHKPEPVVATRSKNDTPADLVFGFKQGAIDPTKPLIYLWEIRDSADSVTYCYAGKAKNGAGRPIKHYQRNVRNLLAGKPYRRGAPDGFREVHHRLAQAMLAGETVQLSFICNVESHEDINEVERRLQRQHGC